MATRENYFILLELSFDPIVNDSAKINAAITAKQQQWSKDMTNPIKKVKAAEYLSLLDKIKEVMLNDASRKSEADAAKKVRDGKIKELDNKLPLYAAKGDSELSEKDLKILLKNFSQYGFSPEYIKKRFKNFVGPEDKIDLGEVIDKNQAKNIKNFMQQLDMKDTTLYQFLNAQQTASCNQLCEAAEKMKKKILAKGEKTGKDNAMQSLCGLCAVIFKDKANKKKYDNYLNLTKYGVVNDAIDEMALSNNRIIEPKMKERLVDDANSEYKISPSEASTYISNYCELMGYQEKDKSIICGLCNAENPATSTSCFKCGKPLILTCPACSSVNGNAAKSCGKCGFDLTKMEQAIELLKKAKKSWSDRNIEEAEKTLKKAKMFWPNHLDVVALEKEIGDFKQKFNDTLSNISEDIKAKRFYAAELKINQAKNDGFKISSDIESKVSNVIKHTETQLAKIKASSGDEAFELLFALTSEISDSIEVLQLIEKYPPEASGKLSSSRSENIITLSWERTTSRGSIEYILMRKENTYPNDNKDGTEIYRGTDTSFSDSTLNKSTVYCYSVFVNRAGVISNATKLDEQIVVVDNVDGVKAVGGDGLVILSWNKPSTVTEIKLWKFKGESQPTSVENCENVKCHRLDGANIYDLENGERYWFYICAYHTIAGKAYPSEKKLIQAVPQKPAKPLSNFTASYSGDIFQAKWDAAEWDVIMFYSEQNPDYAEGVIYDLDTLRQDYKQIDFSLKSMAEAEFNISFIGECYILPGQINASNVILNAPAYISSVPAVKDITFDLNASGTEMYVNFTWPKKIEKSLLVYRMDNYPLSPDDPLAHKIECSKKQYENNEGVLINNPPVGTYHAVVYTYFETEDHRIYSSPVKTIINNEPQRDVYYSFSYKKALFGKKRTLSVSVKSKGAFMFPQFCIVSKFKSVALKRGDGDIVCSVQEETEVIGSKTFEFEVADIRAGSKLKMFFMNDKQYKHFKILNEGSNII